jgi:hypothetical protein
MDARDHALTEEVVRSYGAAPDGALLETAGFHARLPELYEAAAG